jgi:hypothetical protein
MRVEPDSTPHQGHRGSGSQVVGWALVNGSSAGHTCGIPEVGDTSDLW